MRSVKLLIVFVFVGLFAFGVKSRLTMPTAIGQSAPAAPTGVTASDNSYNDRVDIQWNAVRGATSYAILRSTSNDPATAVSVGTTAAPFFFDTTANVGQQYFYWVRAQAADSAGPLSQSDVGTRAVGTQQGPVPPLGPPPPAPPGNLVTAAKATLGKILFWDEQMSSTRTVACGTCHRGGSGGSDPRTVFNNTPSSNPGFDNAYGTADDVYASPGVPQNNAAGLYEWSPTYGLKSQVTSRKAPSYINAVYSPLLFWDGRATGTFRDPLTNNVILNGGGALESQSVAPPVNDVEMAHSGRDWNQAAAQIAQSRPLALSPAIPPSLKTWIAGRTYPELFQEAFGTAEVTPTRIALAIGTFERTLFSDRAPVDLANAGIQPLTAQEQRGRNVFVTNDCAVCHAGELMSDNQFHYIGLRPQNEDTGRFAVTGSQNNLGEFRTPSLRNVELRAPYMHNGRLAALEDVVEFYNRGGDFPNAPNFPGNLIRPRNLTAGQKADLVAFLRRPLTDPRVAGETAPFDRPQLYTESSRVPVIVGQGIAGTNGLVPQPIAIEPPIVGNPSFTVAVQDGLGGANAVLVIDSADPGNTSNIPPAGSFGRFTTQLSGGGYASLSIEIPADASLVGRTFYGRWYISDPGASGDVAVSQAFRFTVFGDSSAPSKAKHADFDGDGKTDVSVFRPSEGNWYILQSSTGSYTAANFGLSNDVLTPEDFDGDGKADIAVFRDGVWYVLRSRDGLQAVQFGMAGDKPQPGDYDGDGIADMAVWRPSDGVWYILGSRDGFIAARFGISTDRPVAADYDGDGRTDPAVYRDGVWYILRSSSGFAAYQFGVAEDKPVLGDYDGDGKADEAVYRPSNGVWYLLGSSGGFSAAAFGLATDIPSPGDYDGDGKNDPAVFRPSTGAWYILQSGNSAATGLLWGVTTDRPVPAAIVP